MLEQELQQCKEQLRAAEQRAIALKTQYEGKILDCYQMIDANQDLTKRLRESEERGAQLDQRNQALAKEKADLTSNSQWANVFIATNQTLTTQMEKKVAGLKERGILLCIMY